jgi:hypothetical protein
VPISKKSLQLTEEERRKAYAPDATVQDMERLSLFELEQLANGGGPSAQNAKKVLDALQLSFMNVFAAAAGLEPLSSLDEAPKIKEAIADHIKTLGGEPDDPQWQDYPIIYLRDQAELEREYYAPLKSEMGPELESKIFSDFILKFGPSLLSRLNPNEQIPTSETAINDPIQAAWNENGRPVEPAKFKELVDKKIIDPKTNDGAAATLAWAKDYQRVKGRQAFNITRDIDYLAGDGYQTLKARAKKFRRKL